MDYRKHEVVNMLYTGYFREDWDWFGEDRMTRKKKDLVTISDKVLERVIHEYKTEDEFKDILNALLLPKLKYIFYNEKDKEVLSVLINDLMKLDKFGLFRVIANKMAKNEKRVNKFLTEEVKRIFASIPFSGENESMSEDWENIVTQLITDIIASDVDVEYDFIKYLLDFFSSHRLYRFGSIYRRLEVALERSEKRKSFLFFLDEVDFFNVIIKNRHAERIFEDYLLDELPFIKKFDVIEGKIYLKKGKNLTKKDYQGLGLATLNLAIMDEKIVRDNVFNVRKEVIDACINSGWKRIEKSEEEIELFKKFLDINDWNSIPDDYFPVIWDKGLRRQILEKKKSYLISDEKVLEYMKHSANRSAVEMVLKEPDVYLSASLSLLISLNPHVLKE